MPIKNFFHLIEKELQSIDENQTSKRNEKIIETFTNEKTPQAVINGKKYYVFNSNDYLGLRLNNLLKKSEHQGTNQYGTGPGAVRFISGSLKIHQQLENELTKFHKKEAAMIFSSAFAANQGVIFPLIIGQRKNTLINDNVLVISDELNHRSIIDAIRLAKLPKENKAIFYHLNINHLEEIIKTAVGKFTRVLIITDGVFSMLGEIQNLKAINKLKEKYDQKFKNGILTIVDDAHGVGVLGKNGQGSEEYCQTQVDVLIGTFGKAFGTDGGYVVGNKLIIDYLKESAATYIYSNNLTPGTTAATLKAIKISQTKYGQKLRQRLENNILLFKKLDQEYKIPLASNSNHPIQPVLIGDTKKTKKITGELFKKGFLTTAISYPVVPQGKDEVRIQLCANHQPKIILDLLKNLQSLIYKN